GILISNRSEMARSLQSRTEARRYRDARHAEHQHGRDEKRRVEGAVSTASAMIFGQSAMTVKGLHWHFLFALATPAKPFPACSANRECARQQPRPLRWR